MKLEGTTNSLENLTSDLLKKGEPNTLRSVVSPGSANPSNKVLKTYRVKSGCFCCRKRKKKCDELRPRCSGCRRNFLKCVYPAYPNQILPKNFELESENLVVLHQNDDTASPELERELNNFVFERILSMASQASPGIKTEDDEDQNELFQGQAQLQINDDLNESLNWETDSDNLSFDLSSFLNSPSSSLTFARFSQWAPNMEISDVNSELYFHFIHQFIPAISPSHADPRLTPKEIWLPLALQSDILREVFYSCGAAQLAYKYPKYQKISMEKYNNSVKMIGEVISKKSIQGTEDWLFAAIMMLCLRDRASGFNGSRSAKHLIALYRIIHQREKAKLQLFSNIDLSATESPELFDIGMSSGFTVTSTERTLVESFLFNYSITLYTCSYENLILLPSPFAVYNEMRIWLNSPIYTDVRVPWMNNPILGSSIKEFEILAKLVWLLRFHYCAAEGEDDPRYINENTFWKTITSIKVDIDNAERANYLMEQEIEKIDTDNNGVSLKTSLYVTQMLFNANKILLQKLVNPALSSSLPLIQESVDIILGEAQKVPKNDHSMCLCVFAIFIAGAACIKRQDKKSIERILIDLSDLLYSSFGLKVLGVLQKSWEREEREAILDPINGYKSFDLIFDREAAEIVSF